MSSGVSPWVFTLALLLNRCITLSKLLKYFYLWDESNNSTYCLDLLRGVNELMNIKH